MKTQTEALEDTIETIGPERHPNFYAPRLTADELRRVIWALREKEDPRPLGDRLQVLLDWKPFVSAVHYEDQGWQWVFGERRGFAYHSTEADAITAGRAWVLSGALDSIVAS